MLDARCRFVKLRMPQRLPSRLCPSVDLADLTAAWCCWEISNLDYILQLNALAGRELGNPACHPMLPWVLDMTQAPEGAMHLVRLRILCPKAAKS